MNDNLFSIKINLFPFSPEAIPGAGSRQGRRVSEQMSQEMEWESERHLRARKMKGILLVLKTLDHQDPPGGEGIHLEEDEKRNLNCYRNSFQEILMVIYVMNL
jgi:hypothetical protein